MLPRNKKNLSFGSKMGKGGGGGGVVDLYMSKYGMSVIPGYSGYIMSLLPIFNNV